MAVSVEGREKITRGGRKEVRRERWVSLNSSTVSCHLDRGEACGILKATHVDAIDC
jgi:hypothetical protein